MPTLDQRRPLVLDTHELGRRPGAEREIALDVPAPENLGVDMLGVPSESPIALAVRLESVMEGVLVTGTAGVVLAGECVRCLDPISDLLTVDLQELYLYDGEEADDEETSRMDGELLDLTPVVRDAVVLSLPQNPLCMPDCPGLCPECGLRLADAPDHSHGEQLDPRWSALRALQAGDDSAPADSKE